MHSPICRIFRLTVPLMLTAFACLILPLPAAWAGSPEITADPDDRDIQWIAEVLAAYTYSDIKDGDSLSGGMLDALLAASWKMQDSRFLIVKYDGGYEKKLDFYSDENGQRPRTAFQEHTLTPMMHWGLGHGRGVALIPSLFYTATLNKDTGATDWNDGLYNYHDLGAGLDIEFSKAGFFGGRGVFSLGMQYYKRHYPNFTSLLDLAEDNPDLGWISVLDTERDEKDYGGHVFRLGYLWASGRDFLWEAEYTLLFKQLDDKKVVDTDGVLTRRKQVDQLHTFAFTPRYSPVRRLHLGLGITAGLNNSNQNFYDGMNSSQISDDVATHDYYDYAAYGVHPEITYRFLPSPVTAKISYSYSQTRYRHRRARTADGSYQADQQRDSLQTIAVKLEYAMSQHWKLEVGGSHTKSRSNNDDQRYYLYDYTLNVFSLGLSYQH